MAGVGGEMIVVGISAVTATGAGLAVAIVRPGDPILEASDLRGVRTGRGGGMGESATISLVLDSSDVTVVACDDILGTGASEEVLKFEDTIDSCDDSLAGVPSPSW